MRGAWDDGGLVPEGLVMADVEGALTCAFMTQSSKPAEAQAVRSASFASQVRQALKQLHFEQGFRCTLNFEQGFRLAIPEKIPSLRHEGMV